MSSKQKNKLYVVNKRPKDALSDVEDEEQYQVCKVCGFPDMPQDGRTFCSFNCKIGANSSYENMDNNEHKYGNEQPELSILLWLEQSIPHYIGYLGQQSYSYATSNDIIVAYNYANMDKDWYLWLLDINKLSPAQFVWFQGENHPKATDIIKDEYFVKQISMIIQKEMTAHPLLSVKIKPFLMTPSTENVIHMIRSKISKNELNNNIITYCANTDWAEKFGNKSCLHRFVVNPDKPSLFEECKIYSQVDGLSECAGYVATNKEELLMSYDKLTKETGRNRVVIKDCFGVSGDDITFYKSKQEIIDNFEWKKGFKSVEMEEDLRYSDNEIEKVEFVGISFYDNKVIGGGHEQIIIDDAEFGGSKTYKNKEIEEQLKRIATDVMRGIGTKYMGGFDFAIQTFKNKEIEPRICLLDMNTARYTATIQTFVIMEKFGIKDKYFIRKTLTLKKNASFKEIMKGNSDILFNIETKRGVYFHMFGVTCGDAIASIFGNDEKDANNILNRIKSLCS